MILAKVLARGQLTIPQEIREKANLNPGDTVEVDVDETGTIRLRRLPTLSFEEMFERNLVTEPVDWPNLITEAEREEADRVLRAMGLEPSDE
jgi:AbrB family looped-hinge helix DNA binding protein